ncbi:GntR family transcriptional regulator [Kribbella italica]|uniref:DNA-binding GntR family transcriptional regulator n=1 Tax=Kribbella italica TaxID=1540520 RepID=A0A7W9MR92_9ACTN|nr:DNA-binding GntR family transcriptional regulator [Kribbella italica]
MTGYREIADELRSAISRGDYPVDSTLPRQADLAEHYGTTVKTVRAAISVLAAEGMVTPVRRRGTVVTSSRPRAYVDPAEGIAEPADRLAARIAAALTLYEQEKRDGVTGSVTGEGAYS